MSKVLTRDELIEVLKKAYPNMFLRTTEEFDGHEGGIWSSGEDGIEASDGFALFDYWSENHDRYEIGVHNEIMTLLGDNGWFAEWYDGGTIMFYKI